MEIEIHTIEQSPKSPNLEQLKYESVEVEGECILLQIHPIRFVTWRYVLFLISNILLMIPWLLSFWYPRFKRYFYFDYCSLGNSTHFYIINYDQEASFAKKQAKVFMIDEETSHYSTYFVNRYMTYIVNDNGVVKVSMYSYQERISRIFKGKQSETGLSQCQAYELINTYGPGTMKIQQPHCVDLTIKEILRPLYLFLLFGVCYWTWVGKYFYYSGVLFFVSLFGLIINIYQMLKTNSKIFGMAYYEITVNVLREGKVQSISSLDVSPGDIIFLKDPIKIPFEGIILEGSALINECALTGESFPIVKKADTVEKMTSQQPIDKNSFIFEGTTIIQVNNKKKMSKFEAYRQAFGIPVCVVRTNFVTTKGQLIRIILFPKEQQNIFQKQSGKFLFFLLVVTVSTYIVLVSFIHSYVEAIDLFLRFVDLITITVPTTLPVSMTFGIIYAVQRLEEKNIFCIAQNKVITGGMIEFACFDKTGTLTEDFMDFYALVPAHGSSFLPAIANNPQSIAKMLADIPAQPHLTDILTNMASNNSIVKIEATSELIGDPMEVKAFEFGLFQLNQEQIDPEIIFGFESKRGHNGAVLRRFEFDSDLQRMSVVCKSNSGKECGVYAKGSPEIMTTIMQSSSIPKDYSEILKQYASRGYRVIAIASKQISPEELKVINRSSAEKDLIFNGFSVFENKLKSETKGAIQELQAAQIDCVMITGDNTLTGSNISYKCNISNKSKGMLICDYVQGKLVEQDFNFQQDESYPQEKQNTKDQKNDISRQIESKEYLNFQTMRTTQERNQNLTEQEFMETISKHAEDQRCQICVTGRAFNHLFPGIINEVTPIQAKFMKHITVFARTKPNDKAKIIIAYQHIDRKVAMCGDGANDCGALKQADIGLSLSMAQASISAPFTSKVANITSMIELIKECRAGLATNFSLFNILTTFSLIEYTITVICQKFLQYAPDMQFLYWDLMLNFFFILFIGFTKTQKKLSKQKPRSSLFSLTNILQVIIAFGTQVAAQISMISIYSTLEADYYQQNAGLDNAIARYIDWGAFTNGYLESNVMFLLSNNIFVITMLAFNIAKPWREYFYKNIPLMVIIVFTLTYNQMLILWEEAALNDFKLGYIVNMRMRWIIFGLSWGFSILIYFNQRVIFVPFSDWLIKKYPRFKWL